MLTKEQRKMIAQNAYNKAIFTNNLLEQKYSEDVLVAFSYKRADAVISALKRSLDRAYSEVTDAQLLDAKHKLNAKVNGNREKRRKDRVAANRAARKKAAKDRKRARAEARKIATLNKMQRKNEEESD